MTAGQDTLGVPSSCYRLQLGPSLRFADALALVPYLDALGVSHVYFSPIFTAVPGSTHGYDVTDPTRLNPELGTEDELRTLSAALRARGMGIILDIVPNHMCVAHASNRWWDDVLENGPGSPYASTFDIDWLPPKAELAGKVLLPVLGDQFGRVLEEGHIRAAFEGGAFHVEVYGSRRLPLGPRTWAAILEPALERVRGHLAESEPHRLELESIITALGYLPPRGDVDPERIRERQREKEVVKRRLVALLDASPEVRGAVEASLADLNGTPGEPRSFDRLERLLADQAFRLCYWRVAADEINYRRFFDINDLAAIRVEVPEVFARVHEAVFRLVSEGIVQGLRVDHVDGLLDPLRYLQDLQAGCRAARGCEDPFYVVAEKILEPGERLPPAWPVAGTTGYDYLNLQNGLFVDRGRRRALLGAYERFAGRQRSFADVLNTSKKLIMLVGMASELHVLTCLLDRISERHRWSRDFTRESLRFALREVVASFPVYRTYAQPDGDGPLEGLAHVVAAVEDAKRRNRATHASIFDYIQSVVLLQDPGGLSGEGRAEQREFVLRLQQFTGPVMAKGLEDTAFYRYFPLASLNEVGGDPTRLGLDAAEFHRRNAARAATHPLSLLATTTHDTKRSEDVRARLNVLSEVPEQWYAAICRWRDLARAHEVELEGRLVPDANDEYLLFQSLVGTLPPGVEDGDEQLPRLRERIKGYMLKALREAKVHTSWIAPNAEYEAATLRLVDGLLAPGPGNRFLEDLERFSREVAFLGAVNGLSQVLLKVGSPGVPDLYQGTELWTLTLVDPDNRQPVDFGRRAALLAELDRRTEEDRGALARELLARWADGAVKLYVTSAALRLRRARRALFERGEYVGLHTTGAHARHVAAFLRRDPASGEQALVAVPRLLARLLPRAGSPVGPALWTGTRVLLPKGSPATWRNALTAEVVTAADGSLAAEDLFATFPVALLHEHLAQRPA